MAIHRLTALSLAILAVGLVWGFMLKSMSPEAYRHIGHMVNNDD